MPVRSKYGYHLIRVNATRPALGEIKLAHIMTRAAKNAGDEEIGKAKGKIERYYEMLEKGDNFTEVAKHYSEDAGTSRNGGQMRWLRSGELPVNIEERVFSLKDSGDFTEPLQSDYGWHIFQLQGKRPLSSFEAMKSKLEERIMGDERGRLADKAMMTRLKKEAGYLDFPENIDALAFMMDSSVYLGKWEHRSAGELIEPVFSIGGREYSQMELATFICTRKYRKEESLQDIVRKKCTELANNELIAWERGRLEEKNPEFKNLMQEYHDGILLFNISDQEVWSKAVTDSAGLMNFFMQHQQQYTWQERADVSVYTLKDISYLDLTRKLARKRAARDWTVLEITSMICNGDSIPCVVVTDGKYEKGDHRITGTFTWKKGYTSVTEGDGEWKVLVVNDILPSMPKQLNEIRGQATADYQNYLDQQWIAALRSKYPVIVNREVLTHVQ
jgi:peptidyl-prolyl cis-trans isomerase SurA